MADVSDETVDDAGVDEQPQPPKGKPIVGLLVAYTAARLGVFVVLVLVFYLVGFRGLPGMLAAAIISIPLSFVLLKTWRVELAKRIEDRKVAQLSLKDEFRNTGR